MSAPSLFSPEEIGIPMAPAGGKKKASAAKSSGWDIEDYLVDVRPYRNLFREKALARRIDPEDFSREALSQRLGMEWLASMVAFLVVPVDRTEEGQRDQLESLLRELETRATRLTNQMSPGYLPADYNEPLIALDLETTGLDQRVQYWFNPETGLLEFNTNTQIVDVCLAIDANMGLQIPVRHTETDGVPNFIESVVVEFLAKIQQRFAVVFHNAQYDREVLVQNKVALRPFPYFFDTQILDYLYDVNQKRHGLKYLSEQKLSRKMLEINEMFGEKDHIAFDTIAATVATVYCSSDACNTFGLFKFYLLNARSPIKNQPIPVQIDHKLEAVLRSMYRTGAPVNIDFFFYAGLDCLKYLRQIQAALNELAGYEVEIGSPKVLSRLLFDEFKLPPLDGEEKNKLGNYSTKEEVLDQLFEKHPDFTVLRYIVQYRKLANFVAKFTAKVLGNSYVDDFQMYARVQYAFSQTNVPTGRLSSSSGGSKERVTVKENKTSLGMTYKKDDWTCGYNSQGVSGSSYRQAKCRKIKSLPERAGFNLQDLYGAEVREELIKAVATE